MLHTKLFCPDSFPQPTSEARSLITISGLSFKQIGAAVTEIKQYYQKLDQRYHYCSYIVLEQGHINLSYIISMSLKHSV